MFDPTGRTDIKFACNVIIHHLYSVTVIATPSSNEWDDSGELDYTAVCGHGVGEYVTEKRLSVPAHCDPHAVSLALARQLVKLAPAGTLAPIGRNATCDPVQWFITQKGIEANWYSPMYTTHRIMWYKRRLLDFKDNGIIGRQHDHAHADMWLNYSAS